MREYTPKEVAHMEGVHVETVYGWIRCGLLVARVRKLRLGVRYRVMHDDYVKFSTRTDAGPAKPC